MGPRRHRSPGLQRPFPPDDRVRAVAVEHPQGRPLRHTRRRARGSEAAARARRSRARLAASASALRPAPTWGSPPAPRDRPRRTGRRGRGRARSLAGAPRSSCAGRPVEPLPRAVAPRASAARSGSGSPAACRRTRAYCPAASRCAPAPATTRWPLRARSSSRPRYRRPPRRGGRARGSSGAAPLERARIAACSGPPPVGRHARSRAPSARARAGTRRRCSTARSTPEARHASRWGRSSGSDRLEQRELGPRGEPPRPLEQARRARGRELCGPPEHGVTHDHRHAPPTGGQDLGDVERVPACQPRRSPLRPHRGRREPAHRVEGEPRHASPRDRGRRRRGRRARARSGCSASTSSSR